MRFLPLLPICLLSLFAQSRAATVYVNQKSPGGVHDGRSWATAYLKAQDATGTAQAGDEIWVAGATYSEAITLKSGVALYGGFSGSEVSRSQRSITANVTILDGGQVRTVVQADASVTQTAVVDGFTIRNGVSHSGGTGRRVACEVVHGQRRGRSDRP